MNDKYCCIDGINIRYWSYGQAEKNLLLIHGLGGSIEAWIENILPFSRNFTTYGIELPGHGKSDKPHLDYTITFLSGFLEKFADKLRISTFHIAGLSFGGAVTLHFTLAHPERIDKLVLVSSAGLSHRMGFLFCLANMTPFRGITGIVPRWLFSLYARSSVYDPRTLPPQVIDFYFHLLRTPDFRRVLNSLQRENFNFFGHCGKSLLSVLSQAHNIDKKTLIIWGKNDTIIPVANAFVGNKMIKNSQLVIFNQCSHNPQYEKKEEFNTVVLDFLLNS